MSNIPVSCEVIGYSVKPANLLIYLVASNLVLPLPIGIQTSDYQRWKGHHFVKTTRVTQEMTILDLLPGDVPAVLLGKETAFNGGKRLFTQRVAVTDAALFQRLCVEVHVGDIIQATIATSWSKNNYTTYLERFCPLSASTTPS